MKRRYHFHAPGLFYLLLTVLVGFAGAFSRYNNLMIWVFGMMLAAVLLSGLISGIMLSRIRVTRLDPGHGQVGEPLTIRYAITNRKRWFPVFDLHIEELSSSAPLGWNRFLSRAGAWALHIGPGETAHVDSVHWPIQRGRPEFVRLRYWSTFPFGMWKKSITIEQPQHTLIYPQILPLKSHVVSTLAPLGLSGVRLSRQTGPGEEFFGAREYRPGDSVRQIAWKRSAGLDQMITIERTRPSPPRLRVVLNLKTPTAELRVDSPAPIPPEQLEEQAISLVASILSAAASQGYETGLTVLGVDLSPTPLRRGHWHLQKMFAALASISLTDTRTRPMPMAEGERAAVVVVHPDRVDPGAARADAMHLLAGQMSRLVDDSPVKKREVAA